ncbi:MAG: TIR domain-containing protein [Acidobacteriia bacterium]|nr:TIR domain-containing protein [Terriglobia bacterium]
MLDDARKLIFISFRDAAPDRDLARALAATLSAEHDVFCSLNLQPGTEWGPAIERALQRADVFLVIVSEALLARSNMVLGEIEEAVRRREQSDLPLIIPVRRGLQGVQLPYPLGGYLNRYQFLQWDGDDAAPVIQAVRRTIHDTGSAPPDPGPWERLGRIFSGSTRSEMMRQSMIERVRHTWIHAVLEQSLYAVARIDIRFEALPSPQRRLVDLRVQSVEESRLLLPGTSIQRIFGEHLGQLLILGVPGVGKTTLLLELARDLLAWSEGYAKRPVPVVLNLSSWSPAQQRFETWIAEEMNRSYDVPRDISLEWVDSNLLMLLLDGLDEVAAKWRDGCVQAFNSFRATHGVMPFVVSSRLAEFESLTEKLRVPMAVVAQPLGRIDVENFLVEAGESLAPVRSALAEDPTLLELIDTPLMLSIMAIGCVQGRQQTPRPSPSDGSVESRRQALFAQYVDAVMLRRSESLKYTREEILRWLSWLAAEMQGLGRTVFHLEDLNRDWLGRSADRRLLWFAMTFGVWLAIPVAWNWDWLLKHSLRPEWAPARAAGLALSAWLIFRPSRDRRPSWTRLRDWILFAGAASCVALTTLQQRSVSAVSAWIGFSIMLGGLALALFWRQRGPGLELPISSFSWDWRWALRQSLWSVLAGAPLGIAIGLNDTIENPDDYGGTWIKALAVAGYGVLVGVCLGLIAFPVIALRRSIPQQQTKPGAGVWRSLRNALLAPLLASVVLLAFVLWLDRTLEKPWYFFILGATVTWGFLRGGLFCLQHLVIRLQLKARGNAPWRFGAFLDSAAELLLLRKVGGGYVFLHRMLLDHFAALHGGSRAEPPKPKPGASASR